MKSLLTLFHTRETVTQEAQVCSTSVRYVPNVRGMGMDFETTQCYSVQPADFSCIAEGCFLVSYIFFFQTTHILFLAFSPLQQFSLLFPCPAYIDMGPLFFPSTSTPPSPNLLFQDAQSKLPSGFCPANPGEATYVHRSWLEIVDTA